MPIGAGPCSSPASRHRPRPRTAGSSRPAAGEQCVVIDPGIGVTGQLDEIIAENRLHPVAVLLTHGHFDHTFSVLPVCQARDVAGLHPPGRPRRSWPTLVAASASPRARRCSGQLTFAEPDDVRRWPTGSRSRWPAWTSRCGTPRATAPARWSSASARHRDGAPVLFSGDVLFAGSIGRVDLPGGSMADMQRLAARGDPAAGRRHRRAPRARPVDHHRARARHQPLPARVVTCR